MIYADGVRKLRQREYDNVDLYSDAETAQAEQKERLQQNFIEYFDKVIAKRHANSSTSILINSGMPYCCINLSIVIVLQVIIL